MSRQPGKNVLIAVIAFVVIAAIVRFFGGPIFSALIKLHGHGGGH